LHGIPPDRADKELSTQENLRIVFGDESCMTRNKNARANPSFYCSSQSAAASTPARDSSLSRFVFQQYFCRAAASRCLLKKTG